MSQSEPGPKDVGGISKCQDTDPTGGDLDEDRRLLREVSVLVSFIVARCGNAANRASCLDTWR
jgi:hypothetical protein